MKDECWGRDCVYWDYGNDCCGLDPFDPDDADVLSYHCPLQQEDDGE